VAKRKRKLTKKQRSAAAKKGWLTRRKRAMRTIVNARFRAEHPELEGIDEAYLEELFAKQIEKSEAEMTKLFVEQQVAEGNIDDDPDEIIAARLKIAYAQGDTRYYEEVLELADEYDYYSPTEIYTMGVSPK
jgi:hypothetical protein